MQPEEQGPQSFVDGAQAYVLTRDWIGATEWVDRDQALAELARRYLAGHGPADDRDLANQGRFARVPAEKPSADRGRCRG